ncbi:glycoside hydrolase [candidate division WOR-1 bacterium RIFOXYA12_FULL_43_27]|uniref:Glycoside hydrolase n=1 Tax=candidate division WOR-1 bacterium RIFOXYC2_FULL_46_14 TaxID=1802587 RepID=A0A1F4U776_UNCSA|nr:MAG: glycoside hydrolase [candidate division WOR-1 bacterium RIFOXYA12_FULL_43_27]OGC19215.1 MAG: glycoside hydrolase [candidate division WOR-1 bacterium RIFOXYB2_FULL_46_45]OGC30204.1 MAG: glycoside hydrolase [candidate division WOR-1 bacterium RIFOXYA2_FULL_46_56]OGC40805.1 MAG: glycoside hydrolase [candidate division WOR-1 bacterium RIFOXYC2_FULL_46_14]
MEKGYLSLILHAHLPFVRHPEYEDFLEEKWLYEAITETYIPLLKVFDKLVEDGVDFRITMTMSPTLLSMLLDPLLIKRYVRHLEKLIGLSFREIKHNHHNPPFLAIAQMYNRNFEEILELFTGRYRSNLPQAFKRLQDLGKLEIITCAATHCFLPLQEIYRPAIRAQIKTAADHYEKIFGRRPRGIWLPECGFQPGDDRILMEEGIKFFITDSHGVLHASPLPKYGIFAPIYCESGVAAFGRDIESSRAVWSAEEGYPGHPDYREFYRGIEEIKYCRITGEVPLENKEPYVREWAVSRAAEHAGNFMFNREKQIEHLNGFLGIKPIVISPYDAELFGHWWYEGPEWINFLIRKIYYDQKTIKLLTPFEYLEMNPENQVSTPSLSSWGFKGYAEVWLEGSNAWIYRHLHKAAERMIELAKNYSGNTRALNQAARELMLLQSSDWAFIMKTGTCVPYAVKRTKDHLERFTRLYEQIKAGTVDEHFLSDIESKDNIFPDIDYRVYAS